MADVRQIHLDLLAALILEGFLAEQVDVDVGAVVQTGGHHAGADGRAELDLQLFQNLEVIGIFQIRLGHEHHTGLVVLQRQGIGFLRAHGHARTAGHTNQNAFGGTHALAGAGLKVKQAGNVDQVVLDPVQFHRDHAGIQRCLALGLFGVKVAGGGAVFHAAHTLGGAAHVQQRFHQSGLAAAGVTGYQNVADVLAGVFHRIQTSFRAGPGPTQQFRFRPFGVM